MCSGSRTLSAGTFSQAQVQSAQAQGTLTSTTTLLNWSRLDSDSPGP